MRSLVPAIVMVVGVHMFKKTYSTARKVRASEQKSDAAVAASKPSTRLCCLRVMGRCSCPLAVRASLCLLQPSPVRLSRISCPPQAERVFFLHEMSGLGGPSTVDGASVFGVFGSQRHVLGRWCCRISPVIVDYPTPKEKRGLPCP